MITDAPPRTKHRGLFFDSDRLANLPLPSDGRLAAIASAIEAAMKSERHVEVARRCDDFLKTAADFYTVPRCTIRVLAARPLRVHERSITELFGDYHPDTMQIRVWMKTAVRKDITSFGTFLSTLCHEFAHHLDFHHFKFGNSWHTRGFYQRTGVLYHHSKGTPLKHLIWAPLGPERWRIDWQRMRRNERKSIANEETRTFQQ